MVRKEINTGKFTTMLLSALLIFIVAASVNAREALFIGLTDNRGQPAQPNMEQAIRHEFSTNTSFRLINELETSRFLREKDRLGHSRTESVIPPSAGLADTVIVIRGVIRDLTITPARRALLWGKIDARMTVEFHYNEVSGPTAYRGEFSAKATKSKGLLLFANPEKTIHISVPERSELTGKMQTQIINELTEFTTMFFNSLITGPALKRTSETDSADEFPGVNELMNGNDE